MLLEKPNMCMSSLVDNIRNFILPIIMFFCLLYTQLLFVVFIKINKLHKKN